MKVENAKAQMRKGFIRF